MPIRVLEDLKTLEKLENVNVDDFVAHLNSNPFKTPGDRISFEEWCKTNSIDAKYGTMMLGFISFAIDFISDKRNFLQGLQELQKLLFDDKPIPEEFEPSWKNLKVLLTKLDNFSLTLKESELSNRLNRISEIKLTCDIRPIFDIERKEIIKYIFPILVTLRETHSGDIINYELTENDLNGLKTEVNFALEKVRLLKHRMGEKS